MDGYLSWGNKTITDFHEETINTIYDQGYVFTRLGKGAMTQTRSVRIDLEKFNLSSENKRVLRKVENVELEIIQLPHQNYDWHIHKMGFDFYTAKFGKGTFSANKIKELLTSQESNFNKLFEYNNDNSPIGYCICVETNKLLHYAYPFYKLLTSNHSLLPNLGIGMMTKAIVWAKENEKKYIYLGSAQNSAAIYKLQFEGLEWFDGKDWQTDITKLKKIISHD